MCSYALKLLLWASRLLKTPTGKLSYLEPRIKKKICLHCITRYYCVDCFHYLRFLTHVWFQVSVMNLSIQANEVLVIDSFFMFSSCLAPCSRRPSLLGQGQAPSADPTPVGTHDTSNLAPATLYLDNCGLSVCAPLA